MREHQEKILRGFCLVLAALLLFQATRAVVRCFPFFGLAIPTVPSLQAEVPPMVGKPGDAPKIPGKVPLQNKANPGKVDPLVKARIDRITETEVLAVIPHPLPMALLGIAGDVAFVRTAGGQTGLLKEGETLAEIKLLRIGTNRVLIEVAGKQQELTIFSGYGGDSLLQTTSESSNENSK